MARRNQIIDPARVDTHNPATALVTDFTKVENDTGLSCWQQAGTKVQGERVTAAQVLERSGNLFTVKTVPSYAKIGDNFVENKNSKQIIRTDTNEILGEVGNKYRVIQNDVQISAISPLVEAGFADYDTAGLVDGGRIGWVMLKLKDEIALSNSNDRVLKYLMALWSHDGSMGFKIFPAPLRAFCANVLNSLLSRAANGISIRHTASADARIKEAARIIEASQGFYKDFAARAEALQAARMTDNQMKALVAHLFPAKENEEGEKVVSTRSENIRNTILDLFVNGAGHEPIRGTAWAGYNAVAEFADHYRATRTGEEGNENDSRLASTMWGSGMNLKTKAINWIDEKVLAA